MDKPRPCGCKGCRTCLLCESEFGIPEKQFQDLKNQKCYVYCPTCNIAWEGWKWDSYKSHPNHSGESFYIGGVYIQEDFLSSSEEAYLVENADQMEWTLSQSGRKKQNFGPKTNFKKRKVACGSFDGFPLYSKFVQDRFNSVKSLKDYRTVEQCLMEYDPLRGASIDLHIDDCWIWGERIVTVNCLSDSVLTMIPYSGDKDKYNLKDVDTIENKSLPSDVVVRIPMPRRSLLVLYGESRYLWEHCILRDDITLRRVCLAYREFTPPYLPGGINEQTGKGILDKCEKWI